MFSCTREVAEAIVADQQEHRRELRESLQGQGVPEPELDQPVNADLTALRFDGDVIIADQRAQYDDPEAIERITPDRDGRYVVMGWILCWEAMAVRLRPHRRQAAQPDETQQWVRLPHTSLRVPHDRLKVTDLHKTPRHNWPAYTATLTLDGEPVGGIQNDGNGGDTDLASDPNRWSWQDMVDYAAASHRFGEPASVQQVLDALVIEAEIDEAVRAVEATGGTLARLVDADGAIRDTRPVTPAPRHLQEVLKFGHTLTRGPDEQWQIWTGATWFTVPGTLTEPAQPLDPNC